MRVDYLTADDVNPALAHRWAKGRGVKIATPRLTGTAPSADALVIDFDHLPDDLRRRWVNAVLLRTEKRPALVHGHNIPEAVADALRHCRATVVVGRLRKSHLLRWLRRVMRVVELQEEKLAA